MKKKNLSNMAADYFGKGRFQNAVTAKKHTEVWFRPVELACCRVLKTAEIFAFTTAIWIKAKNA
jgi:hypothetical protein